MELEPDTGTHRQASDPPSILEEEAEVVVQIGTVGSCRRINGYLIEHEVLRPVLDVIRKICSDAIPETPLQIHADFEVVTAGHVAHGGAGAVLMHRRFIRDRAE